MPQSFEALDEYRFLRNASYLIQTGDTIDFLQRNSPKIKLQYQSACVFAISPERTKVVSAIDERFKDMLKNGAVEEVEKIIKNTKERIRPEVETIHGFREIKSYILGNICLEQAAQIAQTKTRQYAKRQMTWFRNKFDGIRIFEEKKSLLDQLLKEVRSL